MLTLAHSAPTVLENFWALLLKRGIKGTYVSDEHFHLFRYLDEQAFRFNERKHEDGDRGRFWDGLSGVIGKGLRYVVPLIPARTVTFRQQV